MISGNTFDLSLQNSTFVDVLICALGCENRSSALVKSKSIHARSVIALAFPEENAHDYASNVSVYQNSGAEIIRDYEEYFRCRFRDFVKQKVSQTGMPIHIGLDISSMNRTMIATAIASTFAVKDLISRCSIFYLPARFQSPDLRFPRGGKVGAVIPALSGFNADAKLPFGLIMGLGYEYGLGIGLINQVEPRFTICFHAVGMDSRYEESVRAANLGFEFSPDTEIAEYNLLDSAGSYNLLESVCFGLSKNYRIVIVPTGPKIFAAYSVIVALQYFGNVAVWRVVSTSEPQQAVANGEVISFSVDLGSFERSDTSSKLRLLMFDAPQ